MINQKFLTIGVVAVMIAAAIGAFSLLGSGGEDDMKGMTAQVFIVDADTGEGVMADASLDAPSTMETMSMWNGIRQADFKPMEAATVSGIGIAAHYHVFIKLTADVKASTGVYKEVKSSTVTIEGKPAHWDGPHAMGDLVTENGMDKVTSPSNWKLPLNGKTVIQQGGATEAGTDLNLGYHFSDFKDPAGVANSKGVKTLPIRGENLNGMDIKVTVDSTFVKHDGSIVAKSTSATLSITVSSWADSGILLSITNMGFNTHVQPGTIVMAMARD